MGGGLKLDMPGGHILGRRSHRTRNILVGLQYVHEEWRIEVGDGGGLKLETVKD